MRKRVALILALCLICGLCLVYPVYVIRPFRHQGSTELAVALIVLRYRLVAESLCVLSAIVVVGLEWRRSARLRKLGFASAAAFALACLLLSRINIYEKMFHPMEQPAFVSALRSKLKSDELVIAVRTNGEARAYPIRILAYHHIVNDTLGGRAIVATY